MRQPNLTKLANYFYELGVLRRVPRMHQQTILVNDLSDNIASHTFRVAWIGWHLTEIEGLDSGKVMQMCMLHDVPEIRSNDHNWVQKKYVKIFEEEIFADQVRDLPTKQRLEDLYAEYEERKTPEAILAKDADLIDQILLLREYAHAGNKEAESWLHLDNFEKKCQQYLGLKSKSAKKIAKQIVLLSPSDWWSNSWTGQRR